MKKQFLTLLCGAVVVLFSCNSTNSDEVTTTDSSTVMPAATSPSATASTDQGAVTYYDLQTKQPVQVKEDETTHQYVDMTTNKPLTYYYDPIDNDTFDVRGRLVNNALILNDGNYTLDEAKIKSNDNAFKLKTEDMKMKVQADGDTKIKTDDKKIKSTDDKYKVKTDDSKVKITDDKIKIKDK